MADTQTEMVNLRIRRMPRTSEGKIGNPFTDLVFLKDGGERYKGCRPLEPHEVVRVTKKFAEDFLAGPISEYVEMTMEPHTRELYINGHWREGSKLNPPLEEIG